MNISALSFASPAVKSERLTEKGGIALKRISFCSLVFLSLFFLLTVKDGRVCWRETGKDAYVDAGITVAALPFPRDRDLLSQGLVLPNRSALTRALEDFCS